MTLAEETFAETTGVLLKEDLPIGVLARGVLFKEHLPRGVTGATFS